MKTGVISDDRIDYLINTKISKNIYGVLIQNKYMQMKREREIQKERELKKRKVRIEKSKKMNMLLLYSGMTRYGF